MNDENRYSSPQKASEEEIAVAYVFVMLVAISSTTALLALSPACLSAIQNYSEKLGDPQTFAITFSEIVLFAASYFSWKACLSKDSIFRWLLLKKGTYVRKH